ncbi:Poly [ADP-ribose] polymerase 1 [Orchesella cincta]|uniref:Poly [ADP-ribose] polymerase n=1 Tax=Orchesella cincta TaxID=48709 RepID=A0A1D2MJ59_ORCCI|nr:Poly [ADP-ribose] polymerase 1 [Orchesella cincta]
MLTKRDRKQSKDAGGPKPISRRKPKPDILVVPSSNDTSSRKRKREERQIELAAVNILKGIPHLIDRKRAITQWLHVARPVQEDEPIHEFILKYINNSQDHDYGIQVLNILQLVRVDDVDYEKGWNWECQSRMLLWHGTLETKVASILLNGFQLPEPAWQMFGTGLYFADRASKSANYCDINKSPKPNTKGYLLLCDVLIGQAYHATEANNGYRKPPCGCDSVIANGSNVPNPTETISYRGSRIPLGKTVQNVYTFPTLKLLFNEYVVYHPEKVKPLYLVKFEFVTKPVLHVG